MTADPTRLIDAFAGLRVAVIGDAMLDVYLHGSTGRLCPEAPVPVVDVCTRDEAAGGAANVAINVRALGGTVALLAVVGDDAEGTRLGRLLADQGVDTAALLVQPGRRTLAKQRVVAAGQLLVRFDQGDAEPVDSYREAALLDRLAALWPRCDAVIVSDYGYGVLTPGVIRALARLQAATPRLLLVDAKELPAYREAGPTVVKPNHAQAARLLGAAASTGDGDRAGAMIVHGERLFDLTGAQVVAVTLDADGAVVLERGRPAYRTYAARAPHARASGAGDTFGAALALALAAGAHVPAAAELAATAAAAVVGRDGTTACPAAELRERIGGQGKVAGDRARLAGRIDTLRRQGRRLVFTNGCFDILHRGHITYLSRAKALGDVLVVGINADGSIRRLKGPDRPVNPLDDRAHVLAALSCVDYVVPFDEDTPVDLIRALRPDVYVKGGGYTRAMLPEAPVVEALGGTVHILPYVEDRSTSGVIERIRGVRV